MTDSRYVKDGEERVLALYFNTLGFGYALMNSPIEVIDKGMVNIVPVSNDQSMQHVKRLIKKTRPESLVIENCSDDNKQKSERVKALVRRVQRYSQQKGLTCYTYSRSQIRMVFSNWKRKNRYQIAELIAQNLEAYKNVMFEKPKYPKIEHYRSSLFDAASLAITHYYITH